MSLEDLNIEDIYYFLNCYHNTKFNHDWRVHLPSEMIGYKKNILINFWQWNQITSPVVKKGILNLLKLCKYHFIQIHIKEISIKDKWIQEIFHENIRRDSDFWWVHLIEKKYKLSLWDKLFWPKIYSNKYDYNYYLDDILDMGYHILEENLNIWDDFNMRVFDTYLFCWTVLRYIEELQIEGSMDEQIMLLYQDIKSNIWSKAVFWKEIQLAYNIKEYVVNRGYFFHIIWELYKKDIFDIKEVYIHEWYINFVLWRFTDFRKSHFNSLLTSNYSKYSKWELNINWEKFLIKWEIISEILDLIFTAKEKYWNKISFIELEKVREDKDYKNIHKKVLNYELFHNNLKDKEKNINDKWLPEKFFGVSSSWINLTF